MKRFKKKTYIRNGIIYHDDEAIHAKKVSEAEKQVKELKVTLENIAASDSNVPGGPNDPNGSNDSNDDNNDDNDLDMPTFSACNGEKDGLENLVDGGCN